MDFTDPEAVARLVAFVAKRVEEGEAKHKKKSDQRAELIDMIEGVLRFDPTIQAMRFLDVEKKWWGGKRSVLVSPEVERGKRYLGITYGKHGKIGCHFDQCEKEAVCDIVARRTGDSPPFNTRWIRGWEDIDTVNRALEIIIEELTQFTYGKTI